MHSFLYGTMGRCLYIFFALRRQVGLVKKAVLLYDCERPGRDTFFAFCSCFVSIHRFFGFLGEFDITCKAFTIPSLRNLFEFDAVFDSVDSNVNLSKVNPFHSTFECLNRYDIQ